MVEFKIQRKRGEANSPKAALDFRKEDFALVRELTKQGRLP